jgi:hypothetical protein
MRVIFMAPRSCAGTPNAADMSIERGASRDWPGICIYIVVRGNDVASR